MRSKRFLFIIIVFLTGIKIASAQGGYEDLLYREVEVTNPVYMPVFGIGTGIVNYYGELQTDFKNVIQGSPSIRINIFQYIDNKHSWKVNINGMFGTTSGYERNYVDTSMNLNFQTKFYSIGANLEYAFGDLFKGDRLILPFISIGGEYLTISDLRTDLRDGSGGLYQYYPDGTIRVGDRVTTRDYDYETNLKEYDRFGRGNIPQNTFALVVDLGLDFKVSTRLALRLATSLHYTWTDDIDGVSYENTVGRIGNSLNDMFYFTYVSLNIDLFSSPKTITQELLYADVTGDFDYTLIADKDRDGYLDLIDDCPDTPPGVPVDSIGCPYDDDNDGVPNYLDKEQFSNKGAIVDEFGVELSANKIRETLYQDLAAVDRSEVYMVPVGLGWSKYSEMTNIEIPEKYKKLDKDGDEYISFDELLEAINKFFDFDSEFNTDDIYDLNNFFFAQ